MKIQYKLKQYGAGTLHTWTEPPSREAIRQIMDIAEATHAIDPTWFMLHKETHIEYTLEEWFYQYHKEKHDGQEEER